MENDHVYIAIDLKSYYASCECADRKFDPLTTNLVVADMSRTEKTICLAVSPSLKAQGIPGRPRLFEVIQKVKEINAKRLRDYRRSIGDWKAEFKDKSFNAEVLASDPSMELDYFVAPPRMARYMEVSSKIYGIYLKYVAKEDIVVYSIDEVFIDVTKYLSTYKMTAKELAMTMIRDVLHETGITATAGIGTNLYLAKVAMDIVAKHVDADENGVRVAEIDCPHYVSQRRPHMSMIDRAAQFSPFDALEGYSDEIVETGRTTEKRIELSEEQMDELNEKISLLNEICSEAAHSRHTSSAIILPTATITYFVPDKEINRHSKKSGGAYVSYTGQVRRVDMTLGTMTFQGKNGKHKTVAITDISDIQGEFAEVRAE